MKTNRKSIRDIADECGVSKSTAQLRIKRLGNALESHKVMVGNKALYDDAGVALIKQAITGEKPEQPAEVAKSDLLTDEVERLTAENKKLTDEVERLKSKIESLETMTAFLSEQNDKLTEQNEKLTEKNDRLTDKIVSMADQYQKLEYLRLGGKVEQPAEQEQNTATIEQTQVELPKKGFWSWRFRK